jgi:NCS2 family nucleobase:cation symporter-2
MPVVMGISFTFVSVLCVIGAGDGGYSKIMGAVIVGGIAEGLLGLFAKYWRKIISPIVAACVVTSIGFSLFSVGANSFGGGNGAADFGSWKNWLLGGVTLLCCLIFNAFMKGPRKQLSILFGLIVGYITAVCIGKVDFSPLNGVGVISLPKILPVMPEFDIGAIISLIVIFMVSATETIGDTSALAASAFDREPTDREISGSLTCDGFASSVSGLFGCFPITSFSQNIGLVAMTKVVNRYTIATGACIMILAGFFPAVGAVLSTLPEAVLGGCTIMMFGSIVISGIQMLVKCGFSDRNTTIASLSLSVGIGFTLVPEIFAGFPEILKSIFAQNCVAVVFAIALILDLVMPKEKNKSE